MKDPIAIIGLGCRFPGGANSPRQFWELICNKYDAISDIPEDRWNRDAFYNDDMSAPGAIRTRQGGFIDDFDKFDAGFFGISPREANAMDPQQRQLLQVSWEMFEDAGEMPAHLKGSHTGVYIGCFAMDYNLLSHDRMQRDTLGPHSSIGTSATLLSNRLSHFYDFQGPSLSVDTACSSSMIALHLACQALDAGNIERAVVGGVNLIFKPEWTISTSKGGFLSPDGRCKVFDASANGYVRSEGIGTILLKPLSQALADNNRIYALIQATGANQDGQTKSVTVPSRDAQTRLMQAVYQRAGIAPADVGYVEAHGTGTPTGDPIETGAIADVFARSRPRDTPCKIGSVKSNTGHLEAASGMAGLMKAALSLYFEKIPPNIHFNTPNENIPFADWNLKVVEDVTPFPAGEQPRYIGVNSFGFGGSNVHVSLQGAEAFQTTAGHTPPDEDLCLVPLSAHNPESLSSLKQRLHNQLKTSSDTLPAIAAQFAHLRQHHQVRAGIVATDIPDLRDKLTDDSATSKPVSAQIHKTAFVFSGMGPQWWAMGRQLIDNEPVFADKIREIDVHLSRLADWSLWNEMTASEDTSRIEETRIAQPAIFALQVGLSALLASKGITPDAIVGHSAGEVAAAHISGALSLEDACSVIYHRSRLQHETEGQGRIVAAGLSATDSAPYLSGRERDVSLGAINSPTSIALAGDEAVLNAIVAELKEQQIFCKMLNGKVPYHSPKMDPLADELIASLHDLQPRTPDTALYSTVSGAHSPDGQVDGAYWFKNVRNPVLFADAITAMVKDGITTFIELAPHPVLANAIEECAPQATIIPTLRRQKDERHNILECIARLYEAGGFNGWATLYPKKPKPGTPILYPWQLETYWCESEESQTYRQNGGRSLHVSATASHPLLGTRLPSAQPVWDNPLDLNQLAYLHDHKVGDDIVYPGAAYIESAVAVAYDQAGALPIQINDIDFHRALYLTPKEATSIQVCHDTDNGKFKISTPAPHGGWQDHATGWITQSSASPETSDIDPAQLCRNLETKRDADTLYDGFSQRGLTYGPAFQVLQKLHMDQHTAVGELEIITDHNFDDYLLAPVLLDGAFQTFLALLDQKDLTGLYLPTQVDSLRLNAPLPQKLLCRSELHHADEEKIVGDIALYDTNGACLVTLSGFECRAIGAQNTADLYLSQHLYDMALSTPEITSPKDRSLDLQNWIICAHDPNTATSQRLRALLEDKGADVLCIADAHDAELETFLQEVNGSPWGAIFCHSDLEKQSSDSPGVACRENELRLLTLLQHMGQMQKTPTRLCLLSHSPQSQTLNTAGLWGMGRVLANEYPQITCLQARIEEQENLPQLIDLLENDEIGPELIWHQGQLTQHRLSSIRFENLPDTTNTAQAQVLAERILKRLPENPADTKLMVQNDSAGIGMRVAETARARGFKVFAQQECDANADIVLYSDASQDPRPLIKRVACAGQFIDLCPTGSVKPPSFWAQLSARDLSYIPIASSPDQKSPPVCRGDATYLVTGGVRGFGLRVAQWLVENGAKHLVLLGRSHTLNDQSAQEIERLRDQGIDVQVKGCDICDRAALRDIITPLRDGDAPLAGIIHAANIYADAYLDQMPAQDFTKVFDTKAQGAWNLDECSRDSALDFFVLFSSISAIIGNPGQANYVAGNMALSALSHLRRDQGLNSLCIHWGAIGEVGYLARNAAVEKQLDQTGISPLDPDAALNAMGRLMDKDIAEVTLAQVDWARWSKQIPATPARLFEQVTPAHGDETAGGTEGSDQWAKLHAAAPQERHAMMVDQLSTQTANILGLGQNKPDPQQGFADLGMDSMLSVEFRNRLQALYDCTLPATVVFLHPTIDKLAQYLLNDLLADRFNEGEEDTEEDMSLDDIAAQLEQSLAD